MSSDSFMVSLPADAKPTLPTLLSFARRSVEEAGFKNMIGFGELKEKHYLDRDGSKVVEFTVIGDYKVSDFRECLRKYRFSMIVAFGNALGGVGQNGKQNAVG